MRFKVLGSIEVESRRLAGARRRSAAAAAAGRVADRARAHVSADRLVEALWPDGDAPDGAARSVMTYVSRLRAAIGDGSSRRPGSGYRLVCERASCDVGEFEALVAAGRVVAAGPGDRLLRPGAGVVGWRSVRRVRGRVVGAGRVDSARRAATGRPGGARAAALIAIGHHDRAVPDLEGLVVEHPLRERPVSLLMQALAGHRPAGGGAAGVPVVPGPPGRGDGARAVGRPGRSWSGRSPAASKPAGEAALVRPLRGYTIHEAIGEGAYGRVYAATQPGTERRVAIKVIRPELADSAAFIRRFEAEARLVARLEHPHIVPLYDYWREPGGAYLVFRLLAGGTARDSVIRGGPWSLPRVSQLVEEVGGALIAAHAAGVVHNDVKASNVLLDDAGAPTSPTSASPSTMRDDGRRTSRGVRRRSCVTSAGCCGSCSPASPPDRRLDASAGRRADRGSTPSLVGRTAAVPEGLDAVLARATDGRRRLRDGRRAGARLAGRGRPARGVLSPVTSDERRAVDSARRSPPDALAQATAAGVNPYKGLRPFDEADAAGLLRPRGRRRRARASWSAATVSSPSSARPGRARARWCAPGSCRGCARPGTPSWRWSRVTIRSPRCARRCPRCRAGAATTRAT